MQKSNSPDAADSSALPILINWLDEKASQIQRLEQKASRALHGGNNATEYRQLMEEKAQLLEQLADEGAPLLNDLSPQQQSAIGERLTRFSTSASAALNIGSIFYMSALLYPEGHVEGAPNDLELFIAELQERA